MKNFFSLIFLLLSVIILAQEKIQNNEDVPLFLVNNTIASQQLLDATAPTDIESINVYKENSTGFSIPALQHHLRNGIIAVKTKSDIHLAKVTLAQMNLMHNLPEENPVQVNGKLVLDNSLQIFHNAVSSSEIITINRDQLLNILTFNSEVNRVQLLPHELMPTEKLPTKIKERPAYIRQIQ